MIQSQKLQHIDYRQVHVKYRNKTNKIKITINYYGIQICDKRKIKPNNNYKGNNNRSRARNNINIWDNSGVHNDKHSCDFKVKQVSHP